MLVQQQPPTLSEALRNFIELANRRVLEFLHLDSYPGIPLGLSRMVVLQRLSLFFFSRPPLVLHTYLSGGRSMVCQVAACAIVHVVDVSICFLT
jgi:hypothetical protein